MSAKDAYGSAPVDTLDDQAAEWLCRLTDEEYDAEEPYEDPTARGHAFLKWIGRSPEHLRIFLETYEIAQALSRIDAAGAARIESALGGRTADIIRLPTARAESSMAVPVRLPETRSRWRHVAAVGAFAILSVCGGFAWRAFNTEGYSTVIGEQETVRLGDGSLVTLNTDSRVEIAFSAHARDVRLVRGEALFNVAHDAGRPFWVHTATAAVRAVGTEFSMRRRAASTDVAVVEGVVQITVAPAGAPGTLPPVAASRSVEAASAPIRLGAGEQARVISGGVTRAVHPSVADALAWRQRRIVLRDAPLSEIANEFNRYNTTQVIVSGAASAKRFSVNLDADHPEALVLYALKDEALAVRQDGSTWRITER